ncbi:MAG: hypothetical protein ACYCTE_14870 [Acidimicrobiales bacterium]
MVAEIEERQQSDTAQRERLTSQLAKANDRTRKLFNAAVFERLDVKGGQLCHEQYRPPFDGVFTVSEFEYGTRVELRFPYSNRDLLREQLGQLVADLDRA